MPGGACAGSLGLNWWGRGTSLAPLVDCGAPFGSYSSYHAQWKREGAEDTICRIAHKLVSRDVTLEIHTHKSQISSCAICATFVTAQMWRKTSALYVCLFVCLFRGGPVQSLKRTMNWTRTVRFTLGDSIPEQPTLLYSLILLNLISRRNSAICVDQWRTLSRMAA